MSRQFSVIVLCPNARRETLKVSSNSSILQILEEACRKQKLNPGDYDLWHYKKPLDLSLPIRFANLPNNALLELQPAKNPRKECMVTVALQLESGERVMKDFAPSSTLLEVLTQCLHIDPLNSEKMGEPVCIYMRQQIIGEAIKTTTLRSLGLMQGTAIIRLLYRTPEQLGGQAHISSPLTANTSRIVESKSLIENKDQMECVKNESTPQVDEYKSSSMDVDQNDNSYPPPVINNNLLFSTTDVHSAKSENKDTGTNNEQMECESDSKQIIKEESFADRWNKDVNNVAHCEEILSGSDFVVKEEPEEIGSINYIGERHAVLYSLEDITDVKKADLTDEFFELTVDDVKYLMRDYQRERVHMENQPLLTKEQRDKQILQKLAQYSQTVIRIYFPEKLVIQAVFNVTETIQDVQNFIKSYLENKELNFYLYTTPPKEKLNPSKNLLESLLVPAAVVYFGSKLQLPTYLISSLKSMKSDPRAAALAASESRKPSGFQPDSALPIVNIPSKAENSLESTSTSSCHSNQSDGTLPKSAKIPKWMKLGKK